MPAREYTVDGDQGFIGLNSRDNPVNLGKNFVSKSQNFRMDRGVARVRKGTKKLTNNSFTQPIYGACTYTKADGTELTILVVSNGIYTYTPDTDTISTKISFPSGEVITATDEVDVYQAQGVGYVYICRGFAKTTLRWDGNTTIVVPGVGVHNNYPNSRHAVYFGNRHIVQTDQNTIQVSHYLSDSTWSALDMFSINDGSSDRLVGITPWQLNEFVVFMRNSIHYAAVGVGANAAGDAATEPDSYIKSLATDIGCVARGSIVQAGGGIIFLSDNGVYMLNPNGAGQGASNTPEGMRLLTVAEPLSATINDIISRINFNYVQNAVAVYWENRYYLAIPLDSSPTNNTVIVYNFINKAWESVDLYPTGFDIRNLLVAKRGNKRRMIAVDKDDGVFLFEELDWDEYGVSTGTPLLPSPVDTGLALTADIPYPYIAAIADALTISDSAFTPNQISGILTTRAYNFGTNREKRFSSYQADIYAPPGGVVNIGLSVTNPDSTLSTTRFGYSKDTDALIRLPVRKSGHYSQVNLTTTNLRPEVRSVSIEAIVPGHMTQSRK
jgi:hypothetical protein